MKIKKLLIFTCLIILSLMNTSCKKDFFNTPDPNQMTVENFWRNQKDVESALTATYALLQQNWWGGYWGPGEFFMSLEVMSDLTNASIFYPISGIAAYNAVPTMYTMRLFWQDYYKMIYAANQVIENTPNVPGLTKDSVNTFVAEAKFLRAYGNFQLLKLFGNIVLVTKVPKATDDFYKSQSPADKVYAQIESDLQFAEQYLPQHWPKAWLGRATKGAATAYLGKVYLFQKKWAQAEKQFKDVTKMDYKLVDDMGSLFNGLNEFSSESIFEINYSADRPGGRIESESVVPNFNDWLGLWPSQHLKQLFMNDTTVNGKPSKRVFASIVFNNPKSNVWYFHGKTFEQYYGPNEKRVFYKKYNYYNPTNDPYWYASVGTNYVMMRYADVLLMLAEALNEQGKTAEAIPYVNQVRNRAGSVPIPNSMTEAELRHHIREVERPLELCNEMSRFWDLVRWYKDNGGVQAELEANGAQNWDQFNDGVDEIWPIPDLELKSNPKIVQNPGY